MGLRSWSFVQLVETLGNASSAVLLTLPSLHPSPCRMEGVGRRGCLCISAHLSRALGVGPALPYLSPRVFSHSIPVREDPWLSQLQMGPLRPRKVK